MNSLEVFNIYLNLLEETSDMKGKPAQIYNCDESGMPLEHKQPCVISLKGSKKVRQVSSGNKTQITVLGCCSATGQAMPPMVVFSGKRFNHDLSEGEIPGTLYGMSDSGWMGQELFSNWFMNHFLKHAIIVDHYYYILMVILPIIHLTLYNRPLTTMLLFFVSHPIRQLTVNLRIQVDLDPKSLLV